jgi:hypothetical protein
MNDDLMRVDDIDWWIPASSNGVRQPVPVCPKHHLRLKPVIRQYWNSTFGKNINHHSDRSTELSCAEGPHKISLPREYGTEREYVIDKIDAKIFAQMKILNLDDEAIFVAEKELKDKESPYWIKGKVIESKAGTRLIIWAGNRNSKNKTQLFVEPDLKRLSFDQNDDHPTEVFAKVEATFIGKNKTTITKKIK